MNKLLIVSLLTILTVGCGYSSHSTTPPAAGAVPAIASLSPSTANHGGPGFTLSVTGSSFNSNATLNFNGTAMSTTWMSSSSLMVMIPATAIANAGMVQVTVTNPGTMGGLYGGGTKAETSAAVNFTVN